MILVASAALYLGVGLGWAAAVIVLRRGQGEALITEAALLVLFWPLYGPFMAPEPPQAPPEPPAPASDPLLQTLILAQGAPLAALLPDPSQAQRLVAQVEAAIHRVGEIDALLAQPEFSVEDAQRRIAALEAADQPGAARAARGNLRNIERLAALRARSRAELQEVGELMRQLRLQAELVRLSGDQGVGPSALAAALMARVDGLEGVLNDTDLFGASASV